MLEKLIESFPGNVAFCYISLRCSIQLYMFSNILLVHLFSHRMSSEEKSLDPSDKGPSPPPSSAGATPSGSPAPGDKRPRGRPRKDALSTATPLPAVSRQRKK